MTAKRLITALVIATLTVSVGLSHSLYADDTAKVEKKSKLLEAAEVTAKALPEQVIKPTQLLSVALTNYAQSSSDDAKARLGELKTAVTAAVEALLWFKDEIETESKLVESEIEAAVFYAFIEQYFQAKQLLHEVSFKVGSKSGVSEERLNSLKLYVTPQVKKAIALGQAATAQDAQIKAKMAGSQAEAAEPYIGALRFKKSKVKEGMFEVDYSASVATGFRYGAFAARPDFSEYEKLLRFEATRMELIKQARLNGFLFSDEKLVSAMPKGTHASVVALQAEANAIENEAQSRIYMRIPAKRSLKPIIDSALKNQKDISTKLNGFISGLLKDYPEYASVNSFSASTNTYDRFVRTLDEHAAKVNTLEVALKAYPDFLSEMEPDDLADFFQYALSSSAQIALVTLASDVFNFEKVAAHEEVDAAMGSRIANFANELVPVSAIPKDLLKSFYVPHNGLDVVTSFRRYELASQLLIAVDYLDWINDTRKYASDPDLKAVNWAYMPKDHINIGMAFGAAVQMNGLPISHWILEIVQSAVRDLLPAAGDSKEEPLKIYTLVEAMPTEAYSRVYTIADKLSSDKVVSALRKAHQELSKKDRGYAPRSIDKKAELLLKYNFDASVSDAAVEVLKKFREINQLLKQLSSSSFQGRFENLMRTVLTPPDRGWAEKIYRSRLIFNMEDDSFSKFAKDLKNDIRDARMYDSYIRGLFMPERERLDFVRGLVQEPKTFVKYLDMLTVQMENNFPILFHPIKLESKLRKSSATGVDESVPFGVILSRIRKAVTKLDGKNALAYAALSKISKSSDIMSDPEAFLNMDVGVQVSPVDMVQDAMSGQGTDNKFYPFPTWKDLVQRVLMYSQDKSAASMFPPVSDSYWPQSFKVRDVLPALLDPDMPPDSAAEDVKKTFYHRTAIKIAFASLLSAPIRSSVQGAENAIKILADPYSDVKTTLSVSTAYQNLLRKCGDDSLQALVDAQDKVNKDRHAHEELKLYTMKLQEVSHYMFYVQWVMPHLKDLWKPLDIWSHEADSFVATYMVFASALDFSADSMIVADYWSLYRYMPEFSSSGALGDNLIGYTEAQRNFTDFSEKAQALLARMPLDFLFFGQMLQQYAKMGPIYAKSVGIRAIQAWQGRQYVKVAKAEGIKFKDFEKDTREVRKAITDAHEMFTDVGVKDFAEVKKTVERELDQILSNKNIDEKFKESYRAEKKKLDAAETAVKAYLKKYSEFLKKLEKHKLSTEPRFRTRKQIQEDLIREMQMRAYQESVKEKHENGVDKDKTQGSGAADKGDSGVKPDQPKQKVGKQTAPGTKPKKRNSRAKRKAQKAKELKRDK